uniref:hypothetical protein n=1 Tax=Fulvivirga sp. TaxID=1931237 RepID=UPI004048FFB0
MNNYDKILILHALDQSTNFLSVYEAEFKDYYFSFNSEQASINRAKNLLGELESKSLIIYLGHGSSSGLYEPDDSHSYEKYFLDATWGNHFFDEHDIFLLSCKSNDYIKKIYKSNSSIGFGNIISSKSELDNYNENNCPSIPLLESDIDRFNKIYVNASIKVVKKLVNNEIYFFDVPKYLRFMINSNINQLLLDKKNSNRLHFSRLLFDFRNEFLFKKNPKI